MAFVVRISGFAACSAMALSVEAALAHGDLDVERSAGSRGEGASLAVPNGPALAETSGVEVDDGVTGRAVEPEVPSVHGRIGVALDLVLGWGHVPFATLNLPTTGIQAITYTRADHTPSDVQSFVLAGSLDVTDHLSAGVRLPVAFASFTPDGAASRSMSSVGNIEVAAQYESRPSENLRVFGGLGVGLPTAQGDEIPRDVIASNASSVDPSTFDRWSLAHAAAWARGSEEDALFEPRRLGLVPSIGFSFRRLGFSVEPSVKVENLIGTSSSLGAPYLGELVPSLRLRYALGPLLELACRGWASIRFATTAGDRETAVAVEPEILFRLHFFTPYAGAIVPVLGAPFDAAFVGARLGFAGSF